MTTFIQLHLLTSYPASNLNRDDTGRPKSVLIGDHNRLRISSQSLKRAWRTSDLFSRTLDAPLGTRTKSLGDKIIHKTLVEQGVSEERAAWWSNGLQQAYGSVDKKKPLKNNEIAFISPIERQKLDALIAQIVETERGVATHDAVTTLLDAAKKGEKTAKKGKKAEDESGAAEEGNKISSEFIKAAISQLLVEDVTSADIAMFGRMMAAQPQLNIEAAVQVAHAFTVHAAAVEDDYFSAVDDLSDRGEETGAGHIGELGYGAGVFYLYLCINRDLLLKNLGGRDAEPLVQKALRALAVAISQVSPTGKQNSFASRAYASFALAEKGAQQPRSLAQAFIRPVSDEDGDLPGRAVKELRRRLENFDKVYGACADARYCFDVEAAEGTLAELADFIATS